MDLGKALLLLIALLWQPPLPAQDEGAATSRAAPASRRASRGELRSSVWLKLDVDGVTREAWIHEPHRKRSGPSPVVFCFHGHGGSARQVQRRFQLEVQWPEALVVYMQGLPTRIPRIDPEGRASGWQIAPGDQKDRDLRFFDVALEWLKREYRIDEDRVYATGHSNGGTFTYLLWATRAPVFAAFAPSASGSWSVFGLPPKPAMHVAGEQDTLVPLAGQKRTMAVVRFRNGCTGEPQAWAPGCLLYPSTKGAPFVSFIHPGGHEYPLDASSLIVRFFQEHPRSASAASATRPVKEAR